MKTCLKEQEALVSRDWKQVCVISRVTVSLLIVHMTECEVHLGGWLGIKVSDFQQTEIGIMTKM